VDTPFPLYSDLKCHRCDIDIVGVFSPTKENRERFAEQRGIPAIDSLDELIDASDIVHICTPVSTHEQILMLALERDTFPITEKPLTGFCGDGGDSFRGDLYSKRQAVNNSINRIFDAEQKSRAKILYAENWIYAPTVQKEREITEKSVAQILWIKGEQSHSGSAAIASGFWRFAGGGVAFCNAIHPLSAALYLKRKEGLARAGDPILPRSVSARIHEITRLPDYRDQGHLRCEYHDTEDLAQIHVEFEDGTVADIVAPAIVLGGINNRLEVVANNQRTLCNVNPNNTMQTFNPREDYLLLKQRMYY
jgi:predicted dehydrogenase